jgi:predicted GNAT family acetyltransferase
MHANIRLLYFRATCVKPQSKHAGIAILLTTSSLAHASVVSKIAMPACVFYGLTQVALKSHWSPVNKLFLSTTGIPWTKQESLAK